MKVRHLFPLALPTILAFDVFAGGNEDKRAPAIEALWEASGGPNWPGVSTIDFTVSIMQGGKIVITAEHHWDVPAATDLVKWKDKSVTVNLTYPGTDEDSKTAYARWVNDSFWLLAPLKLKDRGVRLKEEGKKTIDGVECEVLHVSFDSPGLAPNDQYWLYLNAENHLVSSCDYMVEPGKIMHASWTEYQRAGGLTLATNHFVDDGVQIRVSNLSVTTK